MWEFFALISPGRDIEKIESAKTNVKQWDALTLVHFDAFESGLTRQSRTGEFRMAKTKELWIPYLA